MKTITKDMTEGSPLKLILSFALPVFLGILFQQCYSIIDTIIVGKFLGMKELAGVGATGSLNYMTVGFCIGTCSGFAIPVAQAFGAKNEKSLRKYVANGAVICTAFAILMTLFAAILCRKFLIWMNTPKDIFRFSYQFMFIIFLGIPCSCLYNFLAGIIRSLGDSRTPVYFLVFSIIVNILLDFTLILGCKMGVRGAAVATVCSQAIAGICCFLYIKKKFKILRLEKEDWTLHKSYVSRLLYLGLPMGLQCSITALGLIMLQTAVNGMGTVVVTAVTIAGRINIFLCSVFDALGNTMTTYGGQNVGAGKIKRVDEGLRVAVIIGIIYSIFAFFILLMFNRPLFLMFVSPKELKVLQLARQFILVAGAFYIPLALVNIIRFLVQGMGFSQIAIFAGVFELAARMFAVFILVPVLGFWAVCLAHPLAWVGADIFLIPAYLVCKRRLVNHR